MKPLARLCATAALFLVTSSSASCTLCKPLVCAVTAPIYVIGNGDGSWGGGCGCTDGRALLCGFAVIAVVGACGGLVTGIVSDVNAICGRADDPTRNFYHPFATNTSEW